MGLDNREVLPPFFPFQRNEDGLFGVLLSGIAGQHCAAFLPGTVLHSPAEDRSISIEELRCSLTRWRVPEYLSVLLSLAVTGAQPAIFSRPLSGVAEDIIAIGSLPLDSFRHLLINLRHMTLVSQLSGIDSRLAGGVKNGLLRSEFEKLRQLLRGAIVGEQKVSVADLEGSDADNLMLIQEFTLSYGMLLKEWPDIHAAAQAFKEESSSLCGEV